MNSNWITSSFHFLFKLDKFKTHNDVYIFETGQENYGKKEVICLNKYYNI